LTAISAALAGVVGVLTGPPATMSSAHTPIGSIRRPAAGNGAGAEPAQSDAIALSPGG
jgi:FlaG/FlaF family flagellin (archaellin)